MMRTFCEAWRREARRGGSPAVCLGGAARDDCAYCSAPLMTPSGRYVPPMLASLPGAAQALLILPRVMLDYEFQHATDVIDATALRFPV